MKYEFEIISTKYGDYLQMNFIGNGNISVLSNLFNSTNINTKDHKDNWIESLNKVISGRSNTEDLGIEAFDVYIEKEKTIIFFDYPKNGEHEFKLLTSKFNEILKIWFDKLDEFETYGKLLD